ncbi:MAG: hypothetical protein DRN04_16750 [Thermoprotei archaeon]|nr:MAG: hypothetical protein DRN04_16750 [Thermoprotei archaeon]
MKIKKIRIRKLKKYFSLKGTNRRKTLVLTILLTILTISIVGTVVSSKIPVEVKSKKKLYTLRHNFQYTYLIGLKPNILYNKTVIGPDEVPYLPISKNVNVTLNYWVDTSIKNIKVEGYIKGVMIIREENGWSKEFKIITPTTFNSTRYNMSFFIDLEEVYKLINKISKETGSRSLMYTVEIKPAVSTVTRFSQKELKEVYYPTFRIKIDHQSNALKFEGEKYAFTRDKEVEITKPNIVKIFYWPIPVVVAKVFSYTALILSSLGLVSLAVTMFRSREISEVERILSKYEDVLVKTSNPSKHLNEAVELNSFEDLVKIAINMGKPIFYTAKRLSENVEHVFWVTDGKLTTKYTVTEKHRTRKQ